MIIVTLYLLFSIFIFLMIFKSFKYKLTNSLTLFIFLITILILNSLRLIGQYYFEDIVNYRELYESIKPIKNSEVLEIENFLLNIQTDIGYEVINLLFVKMGIKFNYYLFILFTVQIAIFYRFSKIFKLDPIIAFGTYISLIMMTFQIGMLRQAIAFCFFITAISYVNRRILYIIIIIAGSLFHKSIIFCFLLVFSDKKINIKYYNIIFIISLFLYLIQYDVLKIIYPEIKGIDEIARVFVYLEVDRENNYLGVGFWERIILFCSLIKIKMNIIKEKRDSRNMNIIYNVAMFSIIFQIIFFSSPTITSRLRLYSQIFPLLYISNYIFIDMKGGLFWIFRVVYIIYLYWYFTYQISYIINL